MRATSCATQGGPAYPSKTRSHRVTSEGRRSRAKVRWGWNGPPSGAAPAFAHTDRMPRARCDSPSPSCSTPAQSTRAAYGLGKLRSPSRGPGQPRGQLVQDAVRDIGHEGKGEVPLLRSGPPQVGPGLLARLEKGGEVLDRLGRRHHRREQAHAAIVA